MRGFYVYACLLVLAVLAPLNGYCDVKVQALTTPKGIPFWLVENKGLPLVGVRVAFRAGSAYDPEGQEGLSALTVSLLNESAGGMDAKTFAEYVQGLGAHLDIATEDDIVGITLTSLRDSRVEAARALHAAIVEPAFTRDDTRRIRDAMAVVVRQNQVDPAVRASRELRKLIYAKHPYGHPVNGYLNTLEKLDSGDVRRFYKTYYTRANMSVSVAGDITPEEAAAFVDAAIDGLPEGKTPEDIPVSYTPPAQYLFVERDIPQTHIRMGHLGIDRKDPDYPAAQLLNYALGGPGFSSRLIKKIRVEAGLAYSVGSYMNPNHVGGTFEVYAQTRNANAERVIAMIKDQIKRIRAYGIEADEYHMAQDYMLGSFPRSIAGTRDLLRQMTIMQMEDLGTDYLNTWPERIRNVTREDIFRVANRLLDPARLTVVAVGGKAADKAGDK
ncbi:MAG: hypothetical protein GC134_04310 [Proteobacteria bacterium]|nr:hypothetical protein [Pseudomonadota bacterium]